MRLSARRHLILMIVALMCMALFTASVGQASPAEQGQGQGPGAAIRLRAATFVPTQGQAPNIPPGLAIAGYPEGQKGYYIVQFAGPVEQAWKDAVTAAGADILDYIPDFAFKVHMNPGQARQVEQLDGVAWVGLFHPAYKLDPATPQGATRLYKVRVERGAALGQTIAAIARSGAVVAQTAGDLLLVAADATQLEATAKTLDVAWIEEYRLPQKHNAAEGQIMGAPAANLAGYDGSTQIAAVADTGLGDGTSVGADIPASRIVAIYNWPGATDSCFSSIVDDGAKDVDSAHGTHVSGSVLGGGASNAEGKGIAPAARLVFQATENYVRISNLCKSLYGYQDGYYLTGIPSDIRTLFQQAYTAGARIHSNSWGSSQAGAYTTDSANADDFIWNHRDMTITFSAGNDGTDANRDGVVDLGSVGSPATAKNVITVGASESERRDTGGNLSYPCDTSLTYTSHDAYQTGQTCTSMGGNNAGYTGTYGSRYPSDFPANPLYSDGPANNAEQMAAWSSRGPADDGRIKPDVVAPGTWVLSTFSPLYREGYGATVNPQNGAYQWDGYGMPYSSAYKYMGGTSMSNPLVAGAATVVRDFYNKKYGASASAALVKATLINSAVDLLDENNDGVNDNDYPIPNNHEGWGRVNLANATDDTAKFVDYTVGLSTGGAKTYSANVTTAGTLKITVVWSDPASSTSASKNLVNDLDLEVTAPNGTTVYRGNNFSGGWSTTATTVDRTNNVENVYVQSAAAGAWTLKVKGYNVPTGPQPFALVVDGAASLNEAAPPTPPGAPGGLTATAISRTQINLTWTEGTGVEDGFKIERCKGATCTNFAQIAIVGANVTSYSNTGLTKNTTYRYRVRAYNAGGDSPYSNTANATTPR